MDMRRALKDRLASYKLPQEMKVLDGPIPRNAMGKGGYLHLVIWLLSRLTMDACSKQEDTYQGGLWIVITTPYVHSCVISCSTKYVKFHVRGRSF